MTSAAQRLRRLAMNRHGKNRDPRLNKGKHVEGVVPELVVAASRTGLHGSHLFGLGETYLVVLDEPQVITTRVAHRSGVSFIVAGFSAQTFSLWRPGDMTGASASVFIRDTFVDTELHHSIELLRALGGLVWVVARVTAYDFDRNPAAILEVDRVYQPD